MLNCFDVANYFLAQIDEEDGDLISNLKLQKLMYYAQGLHLAVHGRSLFAEPIVAWQHGPVVPELYRAFKEHGSGALPKPRDVDFSVYDESTRSLLDEVYSVYGQFSAWKLAAMTHEEEPWREAVKCNGEISHESLRAFFETQLIHA